jgi:hypothetical protein
MLTEVATGHRVADVLAASIAEGEEARGLRRDATAMVERMAAQAHDAGLVHPVAAAVALAARVSQLAGPEEFAERTGVPITRLVEAEAGTVRFGELPLAYDAVLAELGLELLSLADLEIALAGRVPVEDERH